MSWQDDCLSVPCCRRACRICIYSSLHCKRQQLQRNGWASAIAACIIHCNVDILLQEGLLSKSSETASGVDQLKHLEVGRPFCAALERKILMR